MDLSVGVLAYNHEGVLGPLLDSILEQRTKYSFHVIIGVDKSHDGTLSIAKSYRDKFPHRISLIIHEANVGGNANYLSVLRRLSGRFGMVVDGDDIFCPGKIQHVVDYFEMYPEVCLMAHPMLMADGSGKIFSGVDKDIPEGVYGLEFLVKNYIAFGNSQKAFRLPAEVIDNGNLIDFAIDIQLLGSDGQFFFLNKKLGIKRNFAGSITDVSGEKLGVLVEATLKGFDLAYQIKPSVAVQRGRLKYLVTALALFHERDEKALYLRYLRALNADDRFGGVEYFVFRKFSLFPRFQFLILTSVRACVVALKSLRIMSR